MTTKKNDAMVTDSDGLEFVDDAASTEAVRGAYESIEMDAQAKERILAELQKAAAEREADGATERAVEDQMAVAVAARMAGGPTQDASDERETDAAPSEADVSPTPAQRKRPMRAWKVALPVAACLVVAAICVVGVSSQGAKPAELAVEPSTQAQSATASSPSAIADSTNRKEATDAAAPNAAAPDDAESLIAGVPDAAPLAAESGAVEAYEYDGGYYDEPYDPYGDFNTEEYGALKETGFVSTATNPLSTVSADVDTASYCNLRRMLNNGATDLPSGSVRLEEMLNYFTYDYAKPAAGEDFATTVQIAPCPWNRDTQLMTLGFATAPEDTASSKGSNLVFLIDVSGSMDGEDRLGLLQDSFAVLTEQLDANDTVSIVTYSGQEEVVLEGANGADARGIQRAVDSLVAGGSTNGEAGLRMAYDLAEKYRIDGGVNRVIMASDGDLNVGMTSESELYDFVDGKRETGVYLSVLGFGEGNYKDNKMETLADHGNGNYHYIDCIDEAEKVFGSDLMANLVPFADDVKVQVEFNPANVKAYRLIGYENRVLADEDFLDDTVDAGDVGPGAQFTVAYEVALADSALEVDVPELKYGGEAGAADSAGASGDANPSAGAANDAAGSTGSDAASVVDAVTGKNAASDSSSSAASGTTPDAAASAEPERYDGETAGSFADELLTCSLRYHAFADDQVHQTETIVRDADITNRPSDDWTFAASVIEFGMALRGSAYAGTSDMESALDLLATLDLSDERAAYETLVKRAIRNHARTQDAEPAEPVEVVDGNGLA